MLLSSNPFNQSLSNFGEVPSFTEDGIFNELNLLCDIANVTSNDIKRDVYKRQCPKCGSNNIQGISRVTGYLSLDERFGSGKSHERDDRITHTESHESTYK